MCVFQFKTFGFIWKYLFSSYHKFVGLSVYLSVALLVLVSKRSLKIWFCFSSSYSCLHFCYFICWVKSISVYFPVSYNIVDVYVVASLEFYFCFAFCKDFNNLPNKIFWIFFFVFSFKYCITIVKILTTIAGNYFINKEKIK